MIDTYGNDELKKKYIGDLCSFNKLASYCLTEPGSGNIYNPELYSSSEINKRILGSDAAALRFYLVFR